MRRWTPLLALLVFLTACTGTPDSVPSPAPSPVVTSSTARSQDPAPHLPGVGKSFDRTGGSFTDGAVTVDVPAGAVAADSSITVRAGSEVGRISGQFTTEVAGRPVSVDHDRPLESSLTLSWDLPGLTEAQRASVVLVRWDADAKAWAPTTIDPQWFGDTLRARTDHFSIVDWVANLGQDVGELTGSRVDAPTCNGAKLPGWVQQTVDPDEDLSAAAVRVCFETDKSETVTVRVANNRTFTQQMAMTSGHQKWAWTWRGDGHGLADLVVYPSAHDVLDSDRNFLLPPLSTQAVGVARPADPGSYLIAAESSVSWATILVDVGSYVVGQLPIGGTSSPALNALMQVMFECGGKPAAAVGGPKQVAVAVVDAVGSCADEIRRPDSEFGVRFEQLSRQAIAKGGLSSTAAVQANRLAYEASGLFKIIDVGKLAFYGSDQFASSLVKPLTWSIRGRGKQPQLGAWTASCSSYATDSDRLFRNLALQDQFGDTSKNLWQFDGWKRAAGEAIVPLKRCTVAYRSGLATYLPTDWADPKAARVVAAQLLDGLPDASLQAVKSAYAPPMCGYGSYRMVNGQVPDRFIRPGFIALNSTFSDSLDPARSDMDGDGNPDLITSFSCGRGGVNWDDVLGIYGTGTRLLGWVDLRDYNDQEHATVTSMSPIRGGLHVEFESYEGAGFFFHYWQGDVRLRDGKGTLVNLRQREK